MVMKDPSKYKTLRPTAGFIHIGQGNLLAADTYRKHHEAIPLQEENRVFYETKWYEA